MGTIEIWAELLENAKCLMDCEAVEILQGIQVQMVILSEDPAIKIPISFDRGLQYAKRGSHYTSPHSVRRVLENSALKQHNVSDGEVSMIAIVGPESVEEVFALVPSLKVKEMVLCGAGGTSDAKQPYMARLSALAPAVLCDGVQDPTSMAFLLRPSELLCVMPISVVRGESYSGEAGARQWQADPFHANPIPASLTAKPDGHLQKPLPRTIGFFGVRHLCMWAGFVSPLGSSRSCGV
ncbi:unnamed protein product [Ilex paraguariensis]|uniref:Uncharacterized protein n=1 Tax=Ilex paraguariensis TaxID=185542 RepID=A0ABC8R2C5_9AQUA